MRLHYLQHVPFEGIANIGKWAKEKNYPVSGTPLYKDFDFPALDEFDCLVVMGGPMNIYEEKKYPWLSQEKKYIERAIKAEKIVFGICLGAQLIADVLGAKVYKNQDKEIGWYSVSLTEEAREASIFSGLEEKFIAFHWHGDTFSIPSEAKNLARTEACKNQAFEYNGRVIGLQFHLESSYESVKSLVENCDGELVKGRYIQQKEEILRGAEYIREIEPNMGFILNKLDKIK